MGLLDTKNNPPWDLEAHGKAEAWDAREKIGTSPRNHDWGQLQADSYSDPQGKSPSVGFAI